MAAIIMMAATATLRLTLEISPPVPLAQMQNASSAGGHEDG
jgi:uncharacterized lipoprotein YajG